MKLGEFNRENHYSDLESRMMSADELHAQYLKLKKQNAEYIEALREAVNELEYLLTEVKELRPGSYSSEITITNIRKLLL